MKSKELNVKLHMFWSKLDLFCKFATIGIVIVVLLLLIAICCSNGLAILFSVSHVVGFIVVILIHKNAIEVAANNKWMKYFILLSAYVFIMFNIMSYSWDEDIHNNTPTNNQSQSSDSKNNSDDTIVTTANSPINADECPGQIYASIKSSLESAGFTNIKSEKIEDLKLTDADKINVIESISLGGKTDFIKGQEFNKDAEIIIRYHVYEKCNVTIHIDFIPNIIFSKYDVNFLIDGNKEGSLEHGKDKGFTIAVNPGEHIITFENSDSSSVNGEVAVMVEQNTEISLKIYCYSDKISIETIDTKTDTNEDNNDVDNENNTAPSYKEDDKSSDNSNSSKIKITMSEDDFIGMNYFDAEDKLREMGFTKFEYDIIETEDINKPDNTVADVEIKDWEFSFGDFEVGDTFESDATVTLWFYVCYEPEPNLTVDNCPELKKVLTNKAEINDSYSDFADKFEGRIIEFDGRIDYCTNHEKYKTRFDYLVSAGDYDPNHQIGPTFKFEDVNYFDLNTDLDTVNVGLNVRIIAEIDYFDSDTGLFYLNPVSVSGR